MKLYLALFFLGLVYLVSGVFFSSIDLNVVDVEAREAHTHEFFDYSGVLNVHSNKSRGSGRVQDIIASANEANLDFIFFNETNPLFQKQPRPIKFGDVHVFYGSELSFNGSRFLHSSLSDDLVFSSNSDIQLFVSNQLETGVDNLLILAHPKKDGYEWVSQKQPKHLTGVEVLNLREIWRSAWENHKVSFMSAVFFYPFNPSLFFVDIYSDDALSSSIWDDWGRSAKVLGFLGSDVTSKLRVTKNFNLNFPSYKNIFLMAKNHILLSEELVGFGNHKKIYTALKKGQSYFSIDLLGDPKGFAFWGEDVNERKILMGGAAPLDAEVTLYGVVPKVKLGLKILLYRDGEVLETFDRDFIYSVAQKGMYRVEVRVNPTYPLIRNQEWIPWIFSNPIFIKVAGDRQTKAI